MTMEVSGPLTEQLDLFAGSNSCRTISALQIA